MKNVQDVLTLVRNKLTPKPREFKYLPNSGRTDGLSQILMKKYRVSCLFWPGDAVMNGRPYSHLRFTKR